MMSPENETKNKWELTPYKCSYDEALDEAGFGLYTFGILSSCCLLIQAMYLDIFGFSVVLPPLACDLRLTASEQALLSAIPLIGVILSSYAWGLCADTLGRRTTLLSAMTVGAILNILSSFAPTYEALAVIKFFSAAFTASANAAAFVLLAEKTPKKHRNQFMFLMASATMLTQFIICVLALPIFKLTFRISIPWLAMEYRPWRLLMLVISLPGVIGVLSLLAFHESPKLLMSKGKDEEALKVLRVIYARNKGLAKECYPVTSVFLEEPHLPLSPGESFGRKMWNQTAPLFKPPLLKNSLKLYFILLCAYVTCTGFTMWVPTMTNAFFNAEDSSGKTFCQVASSATSTSNSTTDDCDSVVSQNTLYAVMVFSGVSGILNITLSFIVGIMGRRRMTLAVFLCSTTAGIALLFVRENLASIGLFYIFLYVSLILGNVNSYLMELNPTHLRGMATCLSVVVARGFGFISVQVIAALLNDYCERMISGYVALVIAGGLVAITLPRDEKRIPQKPFQFDISEFKEISSNISSLTISHGIADNTFQNTEEVRTRF